MELVGELGSIIAPGLMGGRFPWVCIIIIIVLRHYVSRGVSDADAFVGAYERKERSPLRGVSYSLVRVYFHG